jgi:hypothetical protein
MRYHKEIPMRTTLDIDDDVLTIARVRAARERASIGHVLSALARMALQPPGKAARARNGIALLGGARKGVRPVTLEMVNQLRDELS